jgi:hypothetical protein
MYKKFFSLMTILVFTLILVSCEGTIDSNQKIDETPPTISGIKTIYYSIGDEVPNFLQGISAFDETDGNVTSSIILDTRRVNLSVEGSYRFSYYAFDLSGNKAETEATLVVSGVDVIEQVAPNYPTREFLVKADMITSVSIGDQNSQLVVKPPLINIEYNEAAAQDLTWQTSYNIELSAQNYSRKTTLGLNVLGGGVSMYVKLYTVSGLLLVEREIASTILWREVLIEIPETQRHLLNQPLELIIIAPMPRLGGQAGNVKVSGIWFEGDKEPSVKLEYDPTKYETVYEVDLSDMSNTYDTFDDLGNAGNGLLEAEYNPTTKATTFTNSGYSDWANMAYVIPDKYTNGDLIPLNTVELIIIVISVSQGAIVKGQNDWSSGDLFEFDGNDDSTQQTWILPVGPNGYPVWSAITIAPSYLREGTTSSVIIVHSIKLVRQIPVAGS